MIAPDHGNPEGERALAALGGTTYACLEVLDAWARRRDDPRLLTALTRGPSDPVAPGPGSQGPRGPRMQLNAVLPARRRLASASGRGVGWVGYAPMSSGLTTRAHAGSPEPPDQTRSFEDDILLLAGFERSMEMRLVATVTARLLDRIGADDSVTGPTRPALETSLFGRASSTVRTWLGAPDAEDGARGGRAGG